MSDERFYNLQEARKLGLRVLCEDSIDGHRIRLTVRQLNVAGRATVERYSCERCDVKVRLEYPPLGQ